MPPIELVLAIPTVQTLPDSSLPIVDGQLHLENTYWSYFQKSSNADLVQLFEENVSHPIPQSESDRIRQHASVLFIKGQVKHPKDLLVLARYVNQILVDNETGVYVQNAGICHGADFWKHLAAEDSLDAAVELFVGLHLGDDFMLTQGMEVLGLPDIMVKTDDPDYARELLLTVCFDGIGSDLLKKNARILHGDDEQVYRLQEAETKTYLPDSNNPYGLLRLVKSF